MSRRSSGTTSGTAGQRGRAGRCAGRRLERTGADHELVSPPVIARVSPVKPRPGTVGEIAPRSGGEMTIFPLKLVAGRG